MGQFLGVFVADPPDGAGVESVRELGEEEYRDYVEDVKKVLAWATIYLTHQMWYTLGYGKPCKTAENTP